MAFKKTCFLCGAKSEKLIENCCEHCFLEKSPPISQIKPITLRICNDCGKVHYKHGQFSVSEIQELLPTIIQKNMEINDKYFLTKLEILNFKIINNKVSFEVEVDCDLKF